MSESFHFNSRYNHGERSLCACNGWDECHLGDIVVGEARTDYHTSQRLNNETDTRGQVDTILEGSSFLGFGNY